ncbi:MAG: hypothetical protein ACYTGZ_08865 [Planctomycetota bacterium]
MTTLTLLVLAALTAQAAYRGQQRRRAAHLMRSADEWTEADTVRWLELIEPFPLGVETEEQDASW